MTRAMMRQAWDMRAAQAKDVIASLNEQIQTTEKQSEAMQERIMQATNATVIRAYEGKNRRAR